MSLCNGIIVRLLQLLEITCISILILIKGFINKVSEYISKNNTLRPMRPVRLTHLTPER